MRRVAWGLLAALAFAIPWESTLDLGPPLGSISRLAALGAIAAAIITVVLEGCFRRPGPMQWLVLALLTWLCCSCLWTVDRGETVHHLRRYAQEFVIVWLIWELVDTPASLRGLVRAYVAGATLLALLTVGNFVFNSGSDQVRFVTAGQDPNDVARLLDLGFPLATLLLGSERGWSRRLLAAGYVPLAIMAVVLTASRSGFLAALVALAGCAVLLFYNYRGGFMVAACALPALLAGVWITVPQQTLDRLTTIPAELARGDLNQRWAIWSAGWQAFVQAPLVGSGAGAFVAAARLGPDDTAHNTALAIAVGGGVVGLILATALIALAVAGVFRLDAPLAIAFASILAVMVVSSMIATIEENRATWLLLGLVAVAARLQDEYPVSLRFTFPDHAGDRRIPGLQQAATRP